MRHRNFLYHAAIPRLQELGTGLAPLMGNLFSLERRMNALELLIQIIGDEKAVQPRIQPMIRSGRNKAS
jgi:hypothetical protein